ncbi:hypothetical protein C9413_29985 [Rhizobium sp. SEMIA 4085]|uniref:Uncharacterized protein n=1 Tax=Rhizobium gallicum bv. gallicum R602sp TaxID=1041138 RepID=A0A0B4X3F6_9HYPH|nr:MULTISPECIES: hypothetical protein [Rhizobium]AJD41671.1 hypothetical protein RGR602_CH02345 [Rhizobium gallicum bv. gallicum R602sp]NNH33476.1 hypothetical protein [Rhizobium sp. SEMIA 4085]
MTLDVYEGAQYVFLSGKLRGILTVSGDPDRDPLQLNASDGSTVFIGREELYASLARSEVIHWARVGQSTTSSALPKLFAGSPLAEERFESVRKQKRRFETERLLSYIMDRYASDEEHADLEAFLERGEET